MLFRCLPHPSNLASSSFLRSLQCFFITRIPSSSSPAPPAPDPGSPEEAPSIHSGAFLTNKPPKLSSAGKPRRLQKKALPVLTSTSPSSEPEVPEIVARDGIRKRLDDLGFEEETIALLARKGNKSFLAQCQKIELLLKEGFTLAQLKVLAPGILLRVSLGILSKNLNFIKDAFGNDADTFLMLRNGVLIMSTTNLQSKMKYLKGVGLDQETLCRIVVSHPRIIRRKSQALHACVTYVQQDLGIDKQRMLKLFKTCPMFLNFNVESCLKPKVATLRSLSVPNEKIIKSLFLTPRAFSCSMAKFMHKLNVVQQLGFQGQSKEFSAAWQKLATLPSEMILRRVNRLLGVGFSQSEAMQMVKSYPRILCLSDDGFAKKFRYLVDCLKRDIKETVGFPQYFSYSLESRIMPRFDILAAMKEKGIPTTARSLTTILSYSDEKFNRRSCGVFF